MRQILSKINALNDVKQPCDFKRVKSFLEIVNYFKQFIDDYSTMTCPLRLLVHKNTHFKWDGSCFSNS